MLAETYMKYGDQLSNGKEPLQGAEQYRQAILLLREVLTNSPGSQDAERAQELIIPAYDGLGRHRIKGKSFLAAMEAYTEGKEFAKDSDAIYKMESGYQTALQGLTTDTGRDGIAIMSAALETACKGHPAKSPTISASTDQPPGVKLCDGVSLELPENWRATSPGNLRYVVFVQNGLSQVETCQYSGLSTYTLYRMRRTQKIIVYDSVTGDVASEGETLYGSMPPICPPIHYFTSFKDFLYGNYVPEAELQRAMMDLLSPLLPAPITSWLLLQLTL